MANVVAPIIPKQITAVTTVFLMVPEKTLELLVIAFRVSPDNDANTALSCSFRDSPSLRPVSQLLPDQFQWRFHSTAISSATFVGVSDSLVFLKVVDLTATKGDARDDTFIDHSSELNAISCQRKH